MSWPLEINKIKDNVTTFSESDINPIIEALEKRTDLLKENIINDAVLNGVGFSDIGLSGCVKGQFVAYNTIQQKYIPAEAVWNSDNSLPAESACVIGLLISDVVDENDRGTILVSGIVRNEDLVKKIVGETHKPGNYYLKDNGNVTCNTDDIKFPIYCGNLTATGCFVLGIQVPDFRTHTHTCYTLNSNNWRVISIPPENVTPPEKAVIYYNSVADNGIKNILRTYLSGLTIVVDNKVLFEHIDYEISEGYIWLLKDYGANPNAVMYATNPFMGVVKWLTSMTVAEDNEVLKVSQSGSTAILDVNFLITKDNALTGKAVTKITNKGVEVGDVVHALTAGPGIILTTTGTGSYAISATAYLQRCIELNVLNGNGIVYGGDKYCLFKFPAGKVSSIIGTVRAPSGYGRLNANLFMYVDSLGGTIPTAVGEIHTMLANTDGSVNTGSNSLSFSKPANTGSVINWTTPVFEVASDTLLNITVTLTNPANTVSVRALGVMFEGILPQEVDYVDIN